MHDGVWLDEDDAAAHERLARYCSRCPVSLDRLEYDRESGTVTAEHADRVLTAMRAQRYGGGAVAVGRVEEAPAGRVTMRTAFGSTRIVDVLSGEMLPRIC